MLLRESCITYILHYTKIIKHSHSLKPLKILFLCFCSFQYSIAAIHFHIHNFMEHAYVHSQNVVLCTLLFFIRISLGSYPQLFNLPGLSFLFHYVIFLSFLFYFLNKFRRIIDPPAFVFSPFKMNYCFIPQKNKKSVIIEFKGDLNLDQHVITFQFSDIFFFRTAIILTLLSAKNFSKTYKVVGHH